MIPRSKVGKGVTGAVRYALGEGKRPETGEPRRQPAGEQSRVAWIGGTGFGFEIESREDADLARRIMEFDAAEPDQPHQALREGLRSPVARLAAGRAADPRADGGAAAQAPCRRSAWRTPGRSSSPTTTSTMRTCTSSPRKSTPTPAAPTTSRATSSSFRAGPSNTSATIAAASFARAARKPTSSATRSTKRDAGAVLELMTQQRATFKGRDLERVLVKQIKGEFARAQFAEKVLTHPDAVQLADQADGPTTRYSTRPCWRPRSRCCARPTAWPATTGTRSATGFWPRCCRTRNSTGSRREQARAVRHATGAEGLALIDGQAGTGKSFTMAAIRQVYEAQGYQVIGLAPTNAVAQDMQRDGFAHAGTIHSELFASTTAARDGTGAPSSWSTKPP